jgi:hypothetical protein
MKKIMWKLWAANYLRLYVTWGFNLRRGIVCEWFFVYIPVSNAIISGKKNVENNRELCSDPAVRYAFHGTMFMKMTDCQRNYMEINPKEFSTNRKEIVRNMGRILSSF